MSLSLTIRTDSVVREFPLDVAEIAMFEGPAARDSEIDRATEILFSTANRPRQISASDLAHAAEVLLRSIRMGVGEKNYSICSVRPGEKIGGWGRGQGGVLINGELFWVSAGPERCVLQKIRVREDGRGEIVFEQDVRGKKKIATDNVGDILIRARSKPTQIQRMLRELQRLLRTSPSDALVLVDVG
jgi:hypothetical protein